MAKKIRIEEDDPYIIPNHIQLIRNSKYLSQQDIADMLLVSKSIVSRWENGVRGVSDRHKIELCRLFGCNITELFIWEV
jgi:transcriptional regulator with XRE-family HTH domain